MKGFYNRLLHIDMTRQTYETQVVSDNLLENTLGGKGLAVHLLLELNPPGVDPLAPENHMVIAAGPAAGSSIWGGCRHGIFTKSPQTGMFAESYSGGTVAEYFAKIGYDAIVVSGRSETPVWLEIDGDGVIFHSAQDLWGADTYDTEDRIKALISEQQPEDGKCGVICIGPAGENRVAYAVVENDYWRSAGRTGTGAVMGAKGIKAIAFKGKQRKSFHDAQGAKEFSRELANKLKDNPGVIAYKTLGTPMMSADNTHFNLDDPEVMEWLQRVVDMINVDLVLTTLAAINHVYCKKTGQSPEERLSIAELVKSEDST